MNDTWKIDLRFETTDRGNFISSKSTIRNMDVNQRVLHLANPYTHGGIEFLLRQGNKDYKLEIKGQPLAWGMEAEFGDTKPFDILDPTKPFTMEEVFNWSTCPIRRIDEIKLASHSHRTAHVRLKPNSALTPPPSAAAPPAAPRRRAPVALLRQRAAGLLGHARVGQARLVGRARVLLPPAVRCLPPREG